MSLHCPSKFVFMFDFLNYVFRKFGMSESTTECMLFVSFMISHSMFCLVSVFILMDISAESTFLNYVQLTFVLSLRGLGLKVSVW